MTALPVPHSNLDIEWVPFMNENDVRVWAKWMVSEEMNDQDRLEALLSTIDECPLERLIEVFGANANEVYSEPSATEVMKKARRRFGSDPTKSGFNMDAPDTYTNRNRTYKPDSRGPNEPPQ